MGEDFNPRSRTGSDCLCLLSSSRWEVFQSTLPHGERRPRGPCWSSATCYFNPRSRTGSDRCWQGSGARPTHFNPRSRTGSDVVGCAAFQHVLQFQSTLPHGERRRRLRSFSARPPISIHAPARGATETWTVQRVTFLFQSTLPHGERRQSWPSSSEMVGISIHAPARGATALEMAVEDDLIRFQSTLPHGERR